MMDKVDCAVNSLVEYSETVGTEERKPTTRARTHSEIMRELGYETRVLCQNVSEMLGITW